MNIKAAKYFSMILYSRQKSFRTNVHLKNETKKIEICEFFWGFHVVNGTISKVMCDLFINFLKDFQLDILNLRNQGYDNGVNIKGIHDGLQKKIIDINQRVFVPCATHSLNLDISDTCKINCKAISFFSLVKEPYVFFHLQQNVEK